MLSTYLPLIQQPKYLQRPGDVSSGFYLTLFEILLCVGSFCYCYSLAPIRRAGTSSRMHHFCKVPVLHMHITVKNYADVYMIPRGCLCRNLDGVTHIKTQQYR